MAVGSGQLQAGLKCPALSPGPSALACACRVDANTDRRISAQEMQRWIMAKSAEHLREAVQESRAHFRAVDPDGDGEEEPLSPVVQEGGRWPGQGTGEVPQLALQASLGVG